MAARCGARLNGGRLCARAATAAGPSSAIASARVAISALGTKCVANPACTASAPLSRAPVSPRYMPSAPGSRGSMKVAPTSGNSAIPVSGIANRLASDVTRMSPCTESPMPPPMHTPSMIEI